MLSSEYFIPTEIKLKQMVITVLKYGHKSYHFIWVESGRNKEEKGLWRYETEEHKVFQAEVNLIWLGI